ncbi:MAG: 6-bladed beta-propeller [Gemmataceae bacterium]|nr:6-bladed beta-propeller [Gemmataceae bacterium]
MTAPRFTQAWFCAALCFAVFGCGGGATPELVWGKRGVNGGELVKPRAIAIGPGDRLVIVDWTARIQAFDRDGRFLNASWTTPDYRNGRPSGLSVDFDGNVIVSDSHYNCVRVYSPEGNLIRTIGGELGTKPGQLSYISDAVRDKAGNFYLSEFGDTQRISKFDTDGKFLHCWGEPGGEREVGTSIQPAATGHFAHIRAMTIGPDGNLYIADRCNHRIQVFTTDGAFVRTFGSAGSGIGELSYPNDVACPPDGSEFLYVVEFGNHRVQKFTLTGESLGTWGGPGRGPGQLSSPWAAAVDSRGRVHVLDSHNDRVQRARF